MMYKQYWFQAMICCSKHYQGWLLLPLTSFIAVIQPIIKFCNAFYDFIVNPVSPKYLFSAFIDYDDHFLLQYLHNSTVNFKIVR